MKVLLLENIHPIAEELFVQENIEVKSLKGALTEPELIEAVKGFDLLGIRSKTQLTPGFFKSSPLIHAVGCFCVGTDQVDLGAARTGGVAVFNAPFSNTRSVAEMVIAEIIMLSRKLGTRNTEMHQGIWNKSAAGCFEVRGKTLGIIGYGNIGTQVSMLAESLGMRVVFFDVVSKLALGNAKPLSSMTEVLKRSDFVTLHVPNLESTRGLIGDQELQAMPRGSCLINASRGEVVDLDALRRALDTGHLTGAAIDVFPSEPEKNTPDYPSPFRGYDNVIMTPHIGGATEEAQVNIGREVASTLIRFAQTGSTRTAVNFPEVDVPAAAGMGSSGAVRLGRTRLLNVHKNVKGVLKDINRILSEAGANIQSQTLATDTELGYLVADVESVLTPEIIQALNALPHTLRTRVIFP